MRFNINGAEAEPDPERLGAGDRDQRGVGDVGCRDVGEERPHAGVGGPRAPRFGQEGEVVQVIGRGGDGDLAEQAIERRRRQVCPGVTYQVADDGVASGENTAAVGREGEPLGEDSGALGIAGVDDRGDGEDGVEVGGERGAPDEGEGHGGRTGCGGRA